jgi:hypothetical protein
MQRAMFLMTQGARGVKEELASLKRQLTEAEAELQATVERSKVAICTRCTGFLADCIVMEGLNCFPELAWACPS